ncbi:glycoside hydrolase/deacetylase, partial [Basidiobolus meristosporus CBS 931.73]
GRVAVTFDDGPSQFTPTLLDTLSRYGVKVTFFIVGSMIEDNTQVLLRAYSEGHQIGLHTWSHANLNSLSESSIRQEMEETSDAVARVIGRRPRYMRCPYEACNERVLKILAEMDYQPVGWSLDTDDWRTLSSDHTIKAYENTLNDKSEGFISLQHDIYQSTVEAAPRIIETIRARGFETSIVADCLND